jgi:hypothetical protein
MSQAIKDKETCVNLAKVLTLLLGQSRSEPITIKSESTNVIIDDIEFTGQSAFFYFGETPYPFNIIKNNSKDFNYARIEVMNTLQSNKSCDFIDFKDVFSLIAQLSNKNTTKGLTDSLIILKEKGFQVKQPTVSTNNTKLFITLVKYEITVNFEVKAEFYNHYMMWTND